MDILVLGCSSVFKRRVLPALNSCKEITRINIASESQDSFLFKNKLGNKLGKLFDNYETAINSSCSDLVYISLPNHLHFYWAKKSLESGMNVVVEKPASLNLKDSEFLIDLSQKKNLCLAESTVWSFHPAIDFIKNNLKINRDKSLLVQAKFTVPNFESNNFRNFPEFGGGAFNDLSAYAVSIGRVLFDESPISIHGNLISSDNLTGIDKKFSVEMEFSKNRKIGGIFGFGFDYKNTLKINGNNYSFELDRVFSPPSDKEIDLKVLFDGKATYKYLKADAYAIFFNSIFQTYNTKNKFVWSEILYQDAIMTNKLRSLVHQIN